MPTSLLRLTWIKQTSVIVVEVPVPFCKLIPRILSPLLHHHVPSVVILHVRGVYKCIFESRVCLVRKECLRRLVLRVMWLQRVQQRARYRRRLILDSKVGHILILLMQHLLLLKLLKSLLMPRSITCGIHPKSRDLVNKDLESSQVFEITQSAGGLLPYCAGLQMLRFSSSVLETIDCGR